MTSTFEILKQVQYAFPHIDFKQVIRAHEALKQDATRLAKSQRAGCHCQYVDGHPDSDSQLCYWCKAADRIMDSKGGKQ